MSAHVTSQVPQSEAADNEAPTAVPLAPMHEEAGDSCRRTPVFVIFAVAFLCGMILLVGVCASGECSPTSSSPSLRSSQNDTHGTATPAAYSPVSRVVPSPAAVPYMFSQLVPSAVPSRSIPPSQIPASLGPSLKGSATMRPSPSSVPSSNCIGLGECVDTSVPLQRPPPSSMPSSNCVEDSLGNCVDEPLARIETLPPPPSPAQSTSVPT
jgi:hypothetical protein